MVLSGALQWWEEWQLRILVLSSLSVQCFLVFFASARKIHIRPLFRFFIWLAYLSGDALAIYALATLFNRQNKVPQHQSVTDSHDLEVLWAPILLMHLGGQLNISAYNIEDNELWRRHILTAVSQVTVAVYVFCKSWPSSADKRLLAAAILLFIIGAFKCFEKPMALKRASFNIIVSTFYPAPRTETTKRDVELEEYIQLARDFVQHNQHSLPMDSRILCELLPTPDKLFVDYAYGCRDRLALLKSFWLLNKETTYEALRVGISRTFDVIYSRALSAGNENRGTSYCEAVCSLLLKYFNLLLAIVPIVLFHISHKKPYMGSDIRVTFILLYITFILEILTILTLGWFFEKWSDAVAQHSLIGFLARNRRHARLMGIAEFLKCKGLLDTYFGLRPCYSSQEITMLVRSHVKEGWLSHITDIESYWKFSDTRGNWALERSGNEEIIWSTEKPFDESIILWHVATDLCFYSKGTSVNSECARLCRQISNYMMHLLFANPEMLLPGSRRIFFTIALDELEAILQGDDLSVLDEKGLAQKIIEKIESAKGFIQDSWVLAQELMRIADDDKMWEVIQGVWIEMLCFSAGRCRGYLHAKYLGSGGEYLSFVSLLMSQAGLETFVERQQRVQLRLPKDERMKMATRRRRIQNASRSQAVKTIQGTVPVKEQVNAASLSASEAYNNKSVREEENAATNTSASQCGGVTPAPAPAVKIVVSQ